MSGLSHLDVDAAAERLAGVAHFTQVMTSATADRRAGRRLFFKCENFQRSGAFKFRGAYNALSRLDDAVRPAGVITHSSGNHGQALALAGKILGVQVTVVMPENSSRAKLEATRGYGATVVLCDPRERETTAAALIERNGHALIHPYDDDRIIAGQGTAARELLEAAGELDLLFVPVGGGGLISGSALAAAGRSPRCRVIGVEPERAADANRSFRDGRIHTLDGVPDTIADGLRTRHIGERNLEVMRRYVADMTIVSEAAIVETLRFVWERMKIVIEPSAAVALAPLLTGAWGGAGSRAGVIFSGGNVDLADLPGVFERG